MVKYLPVGLLVLSASVFFACYARLSYDPLANQRDALNNPTSQSAGNSNAPHDPVTDGWMQGATARAWQALTQGGRYRWAGQDDFRFPDWAQQQQSRLDVERAMRTPIQAGHIKGSYGSIEVALIVVDTTRPDWNRYGIVIISERRKKPQKLEIEWLFRNKDLSRVQLNWSSGDTLGIAEYGDDGLRRHCFVKWDAKKRRYLCDLRQVS